MTEPTSTDDVPDPGRDDTLVLLFMCCHPALAPGSAIPLTLRAVGGLTTAEIALAYLVPEATMAQRISRAKLTIQRSGAPFAMPAPDERGARLATVLHVLYLMFNEGHTASSGAALVRATKSGGVDTDGPFAETKEFLAGFWIVDVEVRERAFEIAGRISLAPGPAGAPLYLGVEVREVMSAPPA